MRRPAIERRASYGAHSPLVGERGERTRELLIESALREFAARGFTATSVDEIAGGAEVSRATLYQYFESKEALFVELIDTSGAGLLKLVSSMGDLGPSTDGFAALRNWVSAWTDHFDTYSTVFVEWAKVNSPETPLRDPLDRFLQAHTRRLSTRLRAAGAPPSSASVTAVLMLSLLERGNYVRQMYWPDPEHRAAFVDGVSVALQRHIFPLTPAAVLHAVDAVDSSSALPALDVSGVVDPALRWSHLQRQGRSTVRRLLDAAEQVIGAVGYEAATVEQIVAEAGVARGTFYKYFGDRIEVMHALSDATVADHLAIHDLGDLTGDAALAEWMRRLLEFRRRRGTVLRAWTERVPDDEHLRVGAAVTGLAVRRTLHDFMGPELSPVSPSAAFMAVMALVEYFPVRSVGSSVAIAESVVDEHALRFLRTGVLGWPATRRRKI